MPGYLRPHQAGPPIAGPTTPPQRRCTVGKARDAVAFAWPSSLAIAMLRHQQGPTGVTAASGRACYQRGQRRGPGFRSSPAGLLNRCRPATESPAGRMLDEASPSRHHKRLSGVEREGRKKPQDRRQTMPPSRKIEVGAGLSKVRGIASRRLGSGQDSDLAATKRGSPTR